MVLHRVRVHTSLHLIAGLALCAVLWGCATPQFGESEAGLALEDLAPGLGTSRLEAQTPRPTRQSVEFMTAGNKRMADLYQSPQGARAGIVLVPGVVARGKNDSRLVAMAYTLARLRFAVLVPDMPGVRHYQVRARDVRNVADAFAWLVSRPELAPQGHAGIAGFSYGAGPVLIAAIEPDIREQVRFVMAVGGYYSLQNVVAYLTTGYYSTDARSGSAREQHAGYRPPHPYGEGVFVRSNADLLEHPADRSFLKRYANFIMNSGMAEEEEPIPPRLTPDGQAFYDLLTNHDPARVPELLERLPARIRTELDGINPAARDLSRMQARVILLHGRGDNLVPYTESIALADALPQDQVQLFLIDGLAHVNFKPGPDDMPLLIRAMEALLAERVPD